LLEDFTPAAGPTILKGNKLNYDDWGLEWVGEKKSRGFTWTYDELFEIAYYYKHEANPYSETKAADLLQYISSNSNIRRKFHPYHVENSSRIRNGMESYERLKHQFQDV
jgi:hypothetical protein